MRKITAWILVIILCLLTAGCGEAGSGEDLEALKQQVADLQEENEELKQQADKAVKDEEEAERQEEEESLQQAVPESQDKLYENDFCKLSYAADLFQIKESDGSVTIFSEKKFENGHSSTIVCVKKENPQFEAVTKENFEDVKKVTCEKVCKGMLAEEDGEAVSGEYDKTMGYCTVTENGTEYYVKILSLGKEAVTVACRLYPYEDEIKKALLETYQNAQSKFEDELWSDAADGEGAVTQDGRENAAAADAGEGSIPGDYKSALNKAASYNAMMHMSKTGLYNQLTSEYGENFSAEAAQYAVDHVNADWNANALEKAKSYSGMMHMSKAAVYNQLISEYGEQFTEEEAQYAVDHVIADWNANALAKARNYQSMNMSPAAIREQLVSQFGEQFTAEEADYAIENLNK